MNNKIIIGVIVLLVVVGFIFLSKKPPTKRGNQTAEEIVKNVEKTIGNTGGIVVPPNIKKVSEEMRQKYEKEICQKEEQPYCEYYTQLVKKNR